MSLQAAVKSIRDIMWKDEGVDGDAQRLSQLVWMLFLKIIDDREKQLELENSRYRSSIPEKLRWRNWAANAEGVTGDELLDFVNNELFRQLKDLKVHPEDRLGLIIKEVFNDTFNYMKSGTLIRQVINKINEIDFNKKEDRHYFNEIYEQLLKSLQSAGSYGEYYTPRALTSFVVEMVNPKLGEIILDPACGTGGFLVNTLEYIAEHEVKTQKDKQRLERSIRGIELKQLPFTLALTNLILHNVDIPEQITRGDALSKPLREYGPKDRVDVIVANPPFGGSVKDGATGNFPHEFRTRETADLFLVLFIHLLKPTGRAGIVLPDGTLFGEGVKSAIKQKLLSECNLHTIIRLPQGVFSPYAGVNTNLLFFEKGNPTKEIWYYDMPLPEGMKQYTKNRGIRDEEFDPVRKWWKKRTQNEHAGKVSIKDIDARNYNLDFKNPSNSGTIEPSILVSPPR
ncbi:MAG: SAM-dependent DNA methyltransferase [Candidatus Moraniibacteriota bacterium]|nr:MAG: SAM-dependent DNA methyltransferase [Candidatus Moranbacteria bacterium]